jgi:hypothetical protein
MDLRHWANVLRLHRLISRACLFVGCARPASSKRTRESRRSWRQTPVSLRYGEVLLSGSEQTQVGGAISVIVGATTKVASAILCMVALSAPASAGVQDCREAISNFRMARTEAVDALKVYARCITSSDGDLTA